MSRYRLVPSPAQQVVLRDHCAQTRFGWKLAVEQVSAALSTGEVLGVPGLVNREPQLLLP
jgi:hypothetical protein